jgi:hypothetical protein
VLQHGAIIRVAAPSGDKAYAAAVAEFEKLRKLYPDLFVIESNEQQKGHPQPKDYPGLQIRSVRHAAEIAGLGYRTLKRLLAIGCGPRVVQLTSKRIGILDSDLADWLRSRRRPTPSKAA